MTELHPTDLLPAFSLGCLDEDEQKMVQRHLADCDVCSAELNRYQEVVDQLGLTAPYEPPRLELKNRLMNRIMENEGRIPWYERFSMKKPGLWPAAAMICLLLFLFAGLINVKMMGRIRELENRDYANALYISLRGTPASSPAGAVLIMQPEARYGLLLVHDLPELESGYQYQLWLIKEGVRTSGGVFSVSARGESRLKVVSPQPLSGYDAFGVTVEPFGGSDGPTGQKVLGG